MMPNPSIHNCMDGGHQNATPERRGAVERRGGAAGGLGPLVGGALVQVADWRLAFVVNVPLGLIAIAAARSSVAEAQSKRAERMPDLFGSALLASAAGLLAWTLVDGNNWGWRPHRVDDRGRPGARAWLVLRSRRHAAPAIDLGLLDLPSVRRGALAMMLFGSAFYGLILASVLVLALVRHYSVLDVGLAIAPAPVLAALTAVATGRMATTRGARRFAVAGMSLYAVSTVWLAAAIGADPSYLRDFLAPFLLGSVAVGLTMPSLAAASVSELPDEQFVVGVAINLTARQFGAVLGVALLIAVLGSATHATLDSLRDGMLTMAALSLAAAICALRLPSIQTPTPAPVPTSDPGGGAHTMSELDYLRAIGAGELPPPPMATLMDIPGIEVGEGRALF